MERPESQTAVARERDYWITVNRAGEVASDKVVITFGGQPSDLGAEGFGTEFLRRQGIDSIHVAQAYGTQYQGLSVEVFRDRVGPLLEGYGDVLAYGSSLGGYAALYFGGAVEARIIAAAPMFPAWPALRNRAYAGFAVTHAELWEVPRSRHAPVVILDPAKVADMRVLDGMVRRAYPDLRLVEVPFGGHQVLMALERSRQLKPLILGIIERGEVVEFTPPGEGTAIFHGERGLSLRNSDPEAALRDLEQSLAIKASKRYFNEMVKLLIRTGQKAEAQARIDAARQTGERQHELVASMRKVAAEAGLVID